MKQAPANTGACSIHGQIGLLNMIPRNQVMDYWRRRALERGARTVGYGDHSLAVQDEEYEEKSNFIRKKVDALKRILDYGCGTGRHTCLFAENKYLGVDIIPELLAIAEKDHPNYTFSSLLKIGDVPAFDFEIFFTSTVLQHNSDETLELVFDNVKTVKSTGFQFLLYENSQVFAPHVQARCVNDHVRLISRHFSVKEADADSHVVHGERHDLSVIEV